MAYIIKIPTYKDSKGSLTIIEKILPFDIKRVYYIYNVGDPNIIRGGHRHKKNIQALICINGKCIISNNDGVKKDKFTLDSPDKCLIIEKKDWHQMHSFTSNAILLVLASEYYEGNDYIEEKYDD